ncbi:MAG: RNA polymerase subunit sigma [Labilithrix sp.]|nr:RNA polymerase subunit sigma [Labilithrix sp.]MCW5810833.1 RNA polymerase subunit sigma [Labilithrix sp.]
MAPRSAEELLPVLYDELRRLAGAQMARLRPGQTLQPTALVHEAYLKLAGERDPGWNGRGHFFGAAARAMRDVIVDHARRRSAQKRGGGAEPLRLDTDLDVADDAPPIDDVLAIDAALTALEREHPRKVELVVLRYFGGLTMEETADALAIPLRSAEREWRFARALLAEVLSLSTSGALPPTPPPQTRPSR